MHDNVIGNGLLGSACRENVNFEEGICWFASGVSNSSCNDAVEFEREHRLLEAVMNTHAYNKTLIYFSTCSISSSAPADPTPYIAHKTKMESLAAQHRDFYIFRLPQVVGQTPNPHTLTNYLCNAIIYKKKIKIQADAIRNIIDAHDVVKLASLAINQEIYLRSTINLANTRSYKVIEILQFLEKILKNSAEYEMVEGGTGYEIDTSIVERLIQLSDFRFDSEYTFRVLSKYYTTIPAMADSMIMLNQRGVLWNE
jgi:nucleoside-diphosphate-sugar epimerase